MFSTQEITQYTQGDCHLLCYSLYRFYNKGSIAEIFYPGEDEESEHSLFSFEDGKNTYMDICGSYSSLDHISESWKELTSNPDTMCRWQTKEFAYDVRVWNTPQEIEEWWNRHSYIYTERDIKRTELFIQENLERLRNQPLMTDERCFEIKKKIWGENSFIEIDVSEIIKKSLRGEPIDFSKYTLFEKV
jgi:hypothetical protein